MHDNSHRAEGKPSRRWFQFRLSSWFVLVAILAWAMLRWPDMDWDEYWILLPIPNTAGPQPEEYRKAFVFEVLELRCYCWTYSWPNPVAKWPALALAAFVGWKAAALVLNRRRSTSASQP